MDKSGALSSLSSFAMWTGWMDGRCGRDRRKQHGVQSRVTKVHRCSDKQGMGVNREKQMVGAIKETIRTQRACFRLKTCPLARDLMLLQKTFCNSTFFHHMVRSTIVESTFPFHHYAYSWVRSRIGIHCRKTRTHSSQKSQ